VRENKFRERATLLIGRGLQIAQHFLLIFTRTVLVGFELRLHAHDIDLENRR
jgi:hypothetical protein